MTTTPRVMMKNNNEYPLNLRKIYNGLNYRNKVRTVQGYEFQLAKPHSRNPRHVYIKHNKNYIGKVCIKNNTYYPCSMNYENYEDLLKISETQLESVMAFGKEYGYCGICSKLLTVPLSLERGIGPICYNNMIRS